MLNEAEKSFIAWAEDHAVDMDPKYPDFSHLFDDLEGIRLISFGESQHYCSEFNHLQAEMVKQMARFGIISAFAYETPLADSRLIYDYVLGCETDAEDIVFSGVCFTFSVWKEMRELCHWLREFNRGLPESKKIRYYGVDIGSCAYGGNNACGPLEQVRRYLERVGSGCAAQILPLMERARHYDMFTFKNIPQEERASFSIGIERLCAHMEKNRLRYTTMTGEDEYEWALRCAVNARYCLDCMIAAADGEHAAEVNNVRELCMAENLRWMLSREEKRGISIFHSHNIHIRRTPRPDGTIPAGAYLHSLLKGRGSIVIAATNALTLRADGECREDSLEKLLSSVKKDCFFLDWRKAPPIVAEVLSGRFDRQNMSYVGNDPLTAYDMVYFTNQPQMLSELSYRPFDGLAVSTRGMDLKKFTGQYRLQRCWWMPAPDAVTDILTVLVENDRLYTEGLSNEYGISDINASSAEHFPVNRSELFALSDNCFFWKDWFGRIEFIQDESGSVNRVEFSHYDTAYGNIAADRIIPEKKGGI